MWKSVLAAAAVICFFLCSESRAHAQVSCSTLLSAIRFLPSPGTHLSGFGAIHALDDSIDIAVEPIPGAHTWRTGDALDSGAHAFGADDVARVDMSAGERIINVHIDGLPSCSDARFTIIRLTTAAGAPLLLTIPDGKDWPSVHLDDLIFDHRLSLREVEASERNGAVMLTGFLEIGPTLRSPHFVSLTITPHTQRVTIASSLNPLTFALDVHGVPGSLTFSDLACTIAPPLHCIGGGHLQFTQQPLAHAAISFAFDRNDAVSALGNASRPLVRTAIGSATLLCTRLRLDLVTESLAIDGSLQLGGATFLAFSNATFSMQHGSPQAAPHDVFTAQYTLPQNSQSVSKWLPKLSQSGTITFDGTQYATLTASADITIAPDAGSNSPHPTFHVDDVAAKIPVADFGNIGRWTIDLTHVRIAQTGNFNVFGHNVVPCTADMHPATDGATSGLCLGIHLTPGRLANDDSDIAYGRAVIASCSVPTPCSLDKIQLCSLSVTLPDSATQKKSPMTLRLGLGELQVSALDLAINPAYTNTSADDNASCTNQTPTTTFADARQALDASVPGHSELPESTDNLLSTYGCDPRSLIFAGSAEISSATFAGNAEDMSARPVFAFGKQCTFASLDGPTIIQPSAQSRFIINSLVVISGVGHFSKNTKVALDNPCTPSDDTPDSCVSHHLYYIDASGILTSGSTTVVIRHLRLRSRFADDLKCKHDPANDGVGEISLGPSCLGVSVDPWASGVLTAAQNTSGIWNDVKKAAGALAYYALGNWHGKSH